MENIQDIREITGKGMRTITFEGKANREKRLRSYCQTSMESGIFLQNSHPQVAEAAEVFGGFFGKVGKQWI